MRAAPMSIMSRVVALAWAKGEISNPDVRALLGCTSTAAGSTICNAVRGGYIHQVRSGRPAGFALTPERAEIIASLPFQQDLRMQAEQLARTTQRVGAIQAAQRTQAVQQRRDERDRRAIAQRQARAADRVAAKAARYAADVAARADRKAARQAAKTAALREPTAGQRPPPLPGSRLVAPPPVGTPAPVTVPGMAEIADAAMVQDPKGLLAPTPAPPAAPAPFLVRGGHLAPNDGPYIRPGGLAHLAAPSRRADALVAHRAPLSQP